MEAARKRAATGLNLPENATWADIDRARKSSENENRLFASYISSSKKPEPYTGPSLIDTTPLTPSRVPPKPAAPTTPGAKPATSGPTTAAPTTPPKPATAPAKPATAPAKPVTHTTPPRPKTDTTPTKPLDGGASSSGFSSNE
jgi:hypothetical protein